MKLKVATSILTVAFCAALTVPAFAQNPRAEAEFQNFVATHPALQRNPALMSSPQYMHDHPNFAAFMAQHPGIRQQAHGMINNGRMYGAYDTNHVWRNANWWHTNDPSSMYRNHPEWAEAYPAWRADRTSHPEWFSRQAYDARQAEAHHIYEARQAEAHNVYEARQAEAHQKFDAKQAQAHHEYEQRHH